MKTKIQDKKIIYESGRLVCNGHGIYLNELKTKIENYIFQIRKLKETKGIIIDVEKLSLGIKFEFFHMQISVDKLFEIYNEIAFKEGLTTYSKLWYNPAKSDKFCPIF